MDEDIAHELQGTGIGLSIADQCRLLKISRSGYYRWKAQQDKDARQERQRQLDAKKESELAFASAVLDAWEAHPTYGYRKMSHYMMRNGHPEATEKRVRLMYQRLGLKGLRPRFKTTRPPKRKFKKYPYLLRGKTIAYVNQVWATDITYIKLDGRMVYLTAIIDLYSRKILSWNLSESMDTEFCLNCLHEAVARYGVPAIFNTDCGSQFCSNEFIEALQSYGIEISMDGIGRCLDNVYIERTWLTLKYECIFLHDWRTMKELEAGLSSFIVSFNSERPHQGLDYQIPNEVYNKGCFPVGEDDIKEQVA